MKEFVFKKIYVVSMWVMSASLFMMLFVQGLLPFGITAVWAEKGIGNSIIFVKPDAVVSTGKTVVMGAETEGKVSAYTVVDTVRREGSLQYKVSAYGAPDQIVSIPAHDLNRVALFSIPFLGVWVRILNNTVGVLTLIGLPFFMLSINVLLVVARTVLPILAVLERRAHIKRKNKLERQMMEEQERVLNEEYAQPVYEEQVTGTEELGGRFVTVLKPYNMQKRYGM